MTEGSGQHDRPGSPELSGRVRRRRRMEKLGGDLRGPQPTYDFSDRQIKKEFGKLTLKDQGVVLMSRRNLLGWLAVASTAAGGIGRRFGPGAITRLRGLFERMRVSRLHTQLEKWSQAFNRLYTQRSRMRHRIEEDFIRMVRSKKGMKGWEQGGRLYERYRSHFIRKFNENPMMIKNSRLIERASRMYDKIINRLPKNQRPGSPYN